LEMNRGFMSEWKRDFKNTSSLKDTMRYYDAIVADQTNLDNMDSDTDSVNEVYKRFKTDTKAYTYLTVKYKLAESGPLQIEHFVVTPDTTLYQTNLTFEQFIKRKLPRRIAGVADVKE
jgi:hypothetical protein